MTKQVALADTTYARLRAARHEGESFSDAIERLLSNSKDPMRFLKIGASARDPDEWIAEIEAERDETTTDA